jgi:dinuclear metal center YbgI/SA1388 family protein
MQLLEIIKAIEEIAPLAAAASWDASGLQVAALRQSAAKLAVCLDPTPASIRTALEAGAECVLSHHPLLLKAMLPNRLDAYHEVLRLLFQADVPLYAAHTSLDVNPLGPAGWLAQKMEMSNLSVLEPVSPAQTSGLPLGYGLAGDLPKPLTVQEIAACVAEVAPFATGTICGPELERVRRVAYCTGSGSSLLEAAQAAGAELFITGDVKYHTALAAEICLLDVGHHSLEEEMMLRMSRLLQPRLHGVQVLFVPSVSPFRPVAL